MITVMITKVKEHNGRFTPYLQAFFASECDAQLGAHPSPIRPILIN
jgi:hypothetical protein